MLLPGLHGTSELFSGLIEHLAGVRCIAIRFDAELPLSYEALAAQVQWKLPLEEKFVLLGESFSGPLAVRLAHGNPESCIGLILSTSFVRCPRRSIARFVPSGTISIVIRLLRLKAARGLRDFFLLGRWQTAELSARLTHELACVSDVVLTSRVSAILDVNVCAALAECVCPVLDLRASDDRLLSSRSGTEIREARPEATQLEITGPHLALQTNPLVAAAMIREWIVNLRSVRR